MQNILNKFFKILLDPVRMVRYWTIGFVCFACLTILFYFLPLGLSFQAGYAFVATGICLLGMTINQTLAWYETKEKIKKFSSSTTTDSSTEEKGK